MTNCPCCGAEVRTQLPLVDLNTNTVAFNGKSAKLEPQMAEMLTILVKRAPGTVETDTFIARLWGATEPEDANNCLKVRMVKLRRAVAPLGIRIKNIYGVGYRLALDGAPEIGRRVPLRPRTTFTGDKTCAA